MSPRLWCSHDDLACLERELRLLVGIEALVWKQAAGDFTHYLEGLGRWMDDFAAAPTREPGT